MFPGFHSDQSLSPACLPYALFSRLWCSFGGGSFGAHAARSAYNMLTPFPNHRKGALDYRKDAFNKWRRGRKAIVKNTTPRVLQPWGRPPEAVLRSAAWRPHVRGNAAAAAAYRAAPPLVPAPAACA